MNHQWSPEVSRALHELSDAAPPAPNLTSVLQHRPTTPSSEAHVARLDPEERLAPTKEITVSRNTPTTESRSRRRLLMAAAAAVVVIGLAGIALANNNRDDDQSPSQAPAATAASPTTVAPATTVAPIPGAYVMSEFHPLLETETDVRLTFAVPAGWSDNDWYVDKLGSNPSIGVVFDKVANIYTDSCPSFAVSPPVGPTVDDLASAWANLPGFNATAPIDVTVDGYRGKQVEFTVPDYGADCADGAFRLLGAVGGGAWFAQGPNQHNQLWILDVNGTRLVIAAASFPDTSPQDRAAIDEILASIRIG